MNKSKFRRWAVEQKITLGRGYSWANIPMMGVVLVGAIKTLLPWLVDTTLKFILFTILGLIGLYIIGYIDKKFKFFHSENDYVVEANPHLMSVVDKSSSLPSASKDL